MRARILGALVFLVTFGAAAQVNPINRTIPEGWQYLPGNGVDRLPNGNCEVGFDELLQQAGTRNLTVRCDREIGVWGGVGQLFAADPYRGKRIRFRATLKATVEDVIVSNSPGAPAEAKDARGMAGIWVRVLGASQAASAQLVSDGMVDRALKGHVEWTPAAIVLDVPDIATSIWIGVWVQGRGQVWAQNIQFEEVGLDVPVTALPAPRTGPQNLGLQ